MQVIIVLHDKEDNKDKIEFSIFEKFNDTETPEDMLNSPAVQVGSIISGFLKTIENHGALLGTLPLTEATIVSSALKELSLPLLVKNSNSFQIAFSSNLLYQLSTIKYGKGFPTLQNFGFHLDECDNGNYSPPFFRKSS